MMNLPNSCIAKKMKEFCTRIGADPLLVQGAGGNVSWKEGDVLWVKASGTWLAEAELREIFVPVNLPHLQMAIAKKDFSVAPKVTGDSSLRPSIETLLHALMPHKVVVHLHAVEILAHLVRVNAKEKINKLVNNEIKSIFVNYFKPGADLAKGVSDQLIKNQHADVVFLGNHGVVIGGEDVEKIASTLRMLITILQIKVPHTMNESRDPTFEPEFLARGYIPCGDKEINQLATKNSLASRLYEKWALYPDHVVFLGADASILDRSFDSSDLDSVVTTRPPFIFSIGNCVFESQQVTLAQKVQLRCYYDVISRQSNFKDLTTLNKGQIFEILNWDAEKYRQKAPSD